MAFKLKGITSVDSTPVERSKDFGGEPLNVEIIPLSPQLDRQCRDQAKVRVDGDGMQVLADVERYQRTLLAAIMPKWNLLDTSGQPAKITVVNVTLLMDEDADAADWMRELLVESRELYAERSGELIDEDEEGNS